MRRKREDGVWRGSHSSGFGKPILRKKGNLNGRDWMHGLLEREKYVTLIRFIGSFSRRPLTDAAERLSSGQGRRRGKTLDWWQGRGRQPVRPVIKRKSPARKKKGGSTTEPEK